MRSLSKLLALNLALLGVLASTALPGRAQQTSAAAMPGGRVVLVLPFDNRSGDATLNWIGDSFPDTLDKRLNSAGFLTISHDDRAYALDHLGLPAGFRPSRATTGHMRWTTWVCRPASGPRGPAPSASRSNWTPTT